MRPPNILFMTSHDTGDWLGCYGHRTVHTPNLDALAGEGCRFADAFATCPICTLSRGSMMTGLIRDFSPGRMPEMPTSIGGLPTTRERPVLELYDLNTDPYEPKTWAGTRDTTTSAKISTSGF